MTLEDFLKGLLVFAPSVGPCAVIEVSRILAESVLPFLYVTKLALIVIFTLPVTSQQHQIASNFLYKPYNYPKPATTGRHAKARSPWRRPQLFRRA
jgi:hypothetical protein